MSSSASKLNNEKNNLTKTNKVCRLEIGLTFSVNKQCSRGPLLKTHDNNFQSGISFAHSNEGCI